MKFTFFVIVLFVVCLSSCGPKREDLAKAQYQLADSLFQAKRYNDAKVIIDSVLSAFSDQVEFVTRSQDLLRTITLREQEVNLTYVDSMLLIKQEELKVLMVNFEETPDYGTKVILIHKRQKPENSYNRNYLRAHLDLEGNFFISSRYVGESHINHKQIKVTCDSNEAVSDEIEEDGFLNRHFTDGEYKWEVVSYKDGKDNGVADFIAANCDKAIKVQYIGRLKPIYYMDKTDKEAIRDGYEISFVIKEVEHLVKERSSILAELKRLGSTTISS